MANQKRRATLRMIAEQAGVDISTVSRVLNSPEGGRKWASQAVVDRIRHVAESNNYRRNPSAASLRTNRSDAVGVIVPRLQDFVLATVFEGIEEAASRRGFAAFVANSLDQEDLHKKRVESLLDRRVDGLLIGDAHYQEPYLSELDSRGIPFVLVSRHAGTRYPSATCDDVMGGELAAEHILQLGRRKIGVIAGEKFASTARDRCRGFLSVFREAGINIPEENIVYGPFDAAGGRTAMQELLDKGSEIDAIFATNDFAAIGAMGVLRERGIVVPDDVSVIGYNNTPLSGELNIPLTTVHSPMHEMGEQGFNLLWRKLNGDDPASIRLVPELIKRSTTLGKG